MLHQRWKAVCSIVPLFFGGLVTDCLEQAAEQSSRLHEVSGHDHSSIHEHGDNEKQEHLNDGSEVEIGNSGSMQKVHGRSRSAGSRAIRREMPAQEVFEEEVFDDSDMADLLEVASNKSNSALGWWDRRRRQPCTWLAWGAWSKCTVTCGKGSKKKSRGKRGPFHGGGQCQGVSELTQQCTGSPCPQDCQQSAWSGWSPCPVSCGGGSQFKSRVLTQNAQNGGKKCDDPYLNKLEKACNTHECAIDCEWQGWNAWQPCTASCGGGTKERVRDRVHTKEFAGKDCTKDSKEVQACGTIPCPIDCEVSEWQEWGNCTENCGGGERTRVMTILIPEQHGGSPCPATEENGTCNEDACPIKAGSRGFAEISSAVALLFTFAVIAAAP